MTNSLIDLLETLRCTLNPIAEQDWHGKWRILDAISQADKALEIVRAHQAEQEMFSKSYSDLANGVPPSGYSVESLAGLLYQHFKPRIGPSWETVNTSADFADWKKEFHQAASDVLKEVCQREIPVYDERLRSDLFNVLNVRDVTVSDVMSVIRPYLRSPEPVMVDLMVGATAMHAAGYTNDLSERDGFIQEEYYEQAKACAEAWGLSWK